MAAQGRTRKETNHRLRRRRTTTCRRCARRRDSCLPLPCPRVICMQPSRRRRCCRRLKPLLPPDRCTAIPSPPPRTSQPTSTTIVLPISIIPTILSPTSRFPRPCNPFHDRLSSPWKISSLITNSRTFVLLLHPHPGLTPIFPHSRIPSLPYLPLFQIPISCDPRYPLIPRCPAPSSPTFIDSPPGFPCDLHTPSHLPWQSYSPRKSVPSPPILPTLPIRPISPLHPDTP